MTQIAAGIGEPTTLSGDNYKIRHIGPAAVVWPDSPAARTTVLGCTTMVARPLPSSNLPTSADLVTGSWTGRLGDSGESTLTFPNKEASDGTPWRQRFDPTGHLQFVEIYYNNELESCCVIDQIPTIDQTQVQIHGSDGWFLLKKAYERDWIVTQSPRDVIDRATQVWVPALADNFAGAAIVGSTLTTNTGSWTASTSGSTTSVTLPTGGGVELYGNPASPPAIASATITSPALTVPTANAWRATVNFEQVVIPPGTSLGDGSIIIDIAESNGDAYYLSLVSPYNATGTVALAGNLQMGTGVLGLTSIVDPTTSFTLMLESDGQWVWGFINGQLIGCARRQHPTTTSLQLGITAISGSAGQCSTTVTTAMVESLEPFLMRGTDTGDYVLPGNASTYPNGGLHARYFNDLDLQADSNAIWKVLSPTRTNAYLGSGGSEYMDQQDPQINSQNPPPFSASNSGPGASQLPSWSCLWFGAVYLKMSAGVYTFTTVQYTGAGQPTALALWVGKTRPQDVIINNWSYGTPGTTTFTFSANALAGALPYGAGTVNRDGWYPIIMQYSVGPTQSANAPVLRFTPPVTYTDPGGTALTGGTSVAIPSTSLSPLGCADQRYQGISHYDLAQQTVQAYGYQASVEPKQLESGLFPGVLAPRIREGHDTDVILEPDRGPRQDGEGILNYSSGLDATDCAASLWGNGAGIQNGNQGQLQASVFDAPTMMGSLFDVQQWQDFSDAAFPSLLQALLNSQLGLQLSPWQLLSADPTGRPRNAYAWPLTGTLAQMRWRPGDGLRIHARDINVWDSTPRQMLTVTRNLLPLGIASVQANFAERPRTGARTLKQQLFKATRWQRNYQGQIVTLTGTYMDNQSISAGSTAGFSFVSLAPGDTVVSAWARLNYNGNFSGGAMPVSPLINQVLIGVGPFTTAPVNLNVTGWAQPDSFNRLLLSWKNTGASTVGISYQLIVNVLR